MERVLVPLDGSPRSEAALVHGAALADAFGLPMALVTTRSTVPVASSAPLEDTFDLPLEPAASAPQDPARARRYLEAVASTLGRDDVETILVLDREAADAILAAAGHGDGSLVCMGTHGRSGLRQALLGSVAEEVVRHNVRPTVLVGPHCVDTPRRDGAIVVCSDGSPAADTIVPAAAELAGATGSPAWVIGVAEPPPVGLAERGEEPGESNAVARVAQHLASLGVPADWDVLHGPHVAHEVVRFAAEVPARYLAIATHGRGGLARVVLGSVAMRVVHDAPCPVLVVRPSVGDG